MTPAHQWQRAGGDGAQVSVLSSLSTVPGDLGKSVHGLPPGELGKAISQICTMLTWWAAISGVAQSRTRLKRLSSSSSSSSKLYSTANVTLLSCNHFWGERIPRNQSGGRSQNIRQKVRTQRAILKNLNWILHQIKKWNQHSFYSLFFAHSSPFQPPPPHPISGSHRSVLCFYQFCFFFRFHT